jgi:transposase
MTKKAEWAERVEKWERSGLDAAEFARREGVELAQLEGWCRELRASQPRRVEPRSQATDRGRPCPEPAPLTRAPLWIDIELPNGGLVRLLPGVDATTLACVLVVAGELATGRTHREQTCASPLSPSEAVRK